MEKGELIKWYDAKGYGFIKPERGGSDIFLHITALKGTARKPVLGDIIYYSLSTDTNGKVRADEAKIEGVEHIFTLTPIKQTQKARVNTKTQTNKPVNRRARTKIYSKKPYYLVLLTVIVSIVAFQDHRNSQQRELNTATFPSEKIIESSEPKYQCAGKTRCTEMGSYEEAKFYLDNCPGTKMDGDGDSIPCEQQFGY